MKTVLCFGDSNTYGAMPMMAAGDVRRFDREDRWPGILLRELRPDWAVIEEGLPGRTTVHADPIEGVHKNGLAHLPVSLESHAPIDLVVLMIGSNDLKRRFSVAAEDIGASVGAVVAAIRSAKRQGAGGAPPEVLLVAPPPIAEVGFLAPLLAGGSEKSRRLPGLYRAVAAEFGAAFLDAGSVIHVSAVDGLHFEREQHHLLGAALAKKIRAMFPVQAP
jgi:lysophospholipase L1-like esterase